MGGAVTLPSSLPSRLHGADKDNFKFTLVKCSVAWKFITPSYWS
jgi:hypothetical protein